MYRGLIQEIIFMKVKTLPLFAVVSMNMTAVINLEDAHEL
jgi:hypothetical protein